MDSDEKTILALIVGVVVLVSCFLVYDWGTSTVEVNEVGVWDFDGGSVYLSNEPFSRPNGRSWSEMKSIWKSEAEGMVAGTGQNFPPNHTDWPINDKFIVMGDKDGDDDWDAGFKTEIRIENNWMRYTGRMPFPDSERTANWLYENDVTDVDFGDKLYYATIDKELSMIFYVNGQPVGWANGAGNMNMQTGSINLTNFSNFKYRHFGFHPYQIIGEDGKEIVKQKIRPKTAQGLVEPEEPPEDF